MKIINQIFLTLALLSFVAISPVIGQKEIKLATISEELVVNVTPEKAWKVLNSFGDVGSYHSGIISSKPLNGSEIEGSLGCERQCTLVNGKKELIIDEKIIEFEEGSHYKYWAESEDFPAKAFYNTFGVKENNLGQTVIYVLTEYRMKPGFMTGLVKGKLRKGNKDALLFYKHYMETGEKKGDPSSIKNRYNT